MYHVELEEELLAQVMSATDVGQRGIDDHVHQNMVMWLVHLQEGLDVESEEKLLAQVMAAADVGQRGIGDRVYQNMVMWLIHLQEGLDME